MEIAAKGLGDHGSVLIPGTSRAISSRSGPGLGFGGVTPEVFEPVGESNGVGCV